MNPDDTQYRKQLQQLAADLGLLEQHLRKRAARSLDVAKVRWAAALTRNCISPFLEDVSPVPLHIAVVGGAGTGKSTIANFIAGSVLTDANPQSGYTRHSIAFTSQPGPYAWSQQVGFFGPVKRIFEEKPANLDEDVYQIRQVPEHEGDDTLEKFVVWDCPDMTTWHSTGYVPRLLETTALADVVVFVASDERYNDIEPTEFLQAILRAGKPVIVCLTKMRESIADSIRQHFEEEVAGKMENVSLVQEVLIFPFMSPGQMADPRGEGLQYRKTLLDQLTSLREDPLRARQTAVQGAISYMQGRQEIFLTAAREDLKAVDEWREIVSCGREEFTARYSREFLSTDKSPRFSEALVRLLQLLEIPGVGQYVTKTLWVVRTPYRLLRGALDKFTAGTKRAGIPEAPVLEAARDSWLNLLRKEAAQRGAAHLLWKQVQADFNDGLEKDFKSRFDAALLKFREKQTVEVERIAREIYVDLENSPVALNTLRGTKFTLEVGSIVGVLATGPFGLWDVALVPLVAAVSQELVELMGKQYVETQRDKARIRQKEILAETLSGPLAEWLSERPVSEGSEYEKLRSALKRIPAHVGSLSESVNAKIRGSAESA